MYVIEDTVEILISDAGIGLLHFPPGKGMLFERASLMGFLLSIESDPKAAFVCRKTDRTETGRLQELLWESSDYYAWSCLIRDDVLSVITKAQPLSARFLIA